MPSYYSTIVFLIWISLTVLCILVWENEHVKKESKKLFYLTYLIIAVSALSEWLGVLFNGNMNIPKWVIILVKTFDYILTPMAGGALVGQMRFKNILSNPASDCGAFSLIFLVIRLS